VLAGNMLTGVFVSAGGMATVLWLPSKLLGFQ